jgi:hypothetical protein
MANLLTELQDLITEKPYIGKVVGFDKGKTLIATEKGLERVTQNLPLNTKVVLYKGIVSRVLSSSGVASYEV